MSTLKTNNVQVGQSVTATNNFTIYQPSSPDGTVRIGVGNSGATTGDAVTIDSTGIVKGTLAARTAVAATSGTSIDFSSIPSTTKRITVIFNGVSTNGTSKLIVRIGTGGTPTTSGYVGQSSIVYSSVATTPETTGFPVFYDTATFTITGSVVIQNIANNTWVMNGCGSNAGGTAFTWISGGNLSLAGVLDFVRVTTVGGTNTFDAGTVNIFLEG
jgi:hypothetical protein